MIDEAQAKRLSGRQLRTRDNDKIGTIGQVYIDDYHGRPEWVTVNTGLFGTNESFVPLAEADVSGDDLVVPYTKDQIKAAPNIDDSGQLTEAEEQALYEHYGVPYTTEGSTFATAGTTGTGSEQTTGYAGTDTETSTHDTAGTDHTGTARSEDTRTDGGDDAGVPGERGTDDAMTRSEEKLDVGTERVRSGTARLRKWVETETVQVDVPIRTEKAVLVTEPVTDENRGDAFDSPDIGEDEHVVVLNTERPVVSKETVAKERVRLDTQVEQSTETVSEDVRKERIELDGDGDPSDRR